MNSKVAIFISDVHLARGDELEDFSVDNEIAFTRFLARQSEIYQNDDVDLVVLGDLVDIWQTVSDDDKVAPDSTSIDVSVTVPVDTSKVNQIIHAHSDFFKALKVFLVKDSNRRRIILITGNHDHSLVHTDLQQCIRQAVTGGTSGLDGCIRFAHYYDEPELRVYAEHGNQYDVNNDYDDFAKFGDECPGFFFVRLFWNRLEPLDPDLDNWQNYFQEIIEKNLWHLIRPAYKFFSQYEGDSRPFERIEVLGIPLFVADGKTFPRPVSGKSLPGSPDILFSERGDPVRIFSTDAATENQLRMIYHDPGKAKFKIAIDEILQEKYHGNPPDVPTQLVLSMAEYGVFHDEYVTAVTEMFEPQGSDRSTKPLKNELLSDKVYNYVLLGHTHKDKKVVLGDLNVTYFNTGTWRTMRGPSGQNQSRLCYVTIQKSQEGKVTVSEDYWKLT